MDPYYKQLYETSHTDQMDQPAPFTRFSPGYSRYSSNPLYDEPDQRPYEPQRDLRIRKYQPPPKPQRLTVLGAIGALGGALGTSLMQYIPNGANFLNSISPFQIGSPEFGNGSQPAIEYYFADPTKTEEWKANEWESWKEKIEGTEWAKFNELVEKERLVWLAAKEQDWSEYMKYIEYKWTHYSSEFEKCIKSDILKRSRALDEGEWDEWMRTEGKQLIQKDWNDWLANNEAYLNVWTVQEWKKWRNQIITKWLSSDWKREEDEHWARWEEAWVKHCDPEERNAWIAWRARINKEMVEWNTWTKEKEEQLIDHKTGTWGQWKVEKQALFDMWLDNFIDEWIKEKQWFIWTSERSNYFSRNRYMRSNQIM
ncbi:tryptophan/threonine-rich antigen, putative [Plasmodium chabaudi adami]|uniref:Tryptophan/threonine-rich antigen, putative n=1 Tax=Plasmodium chabaudi adami TaxID=5826 RepID=A0A1C6XHW7_PLACE|nr:tryptophan/threonine-rich antigen, putative [Plasmodium chabaudi adami]